MPLFLRSMGPRNGAEAPFLGPKTTPSGERNPFSGRKKIAPISHKVRTLLFILWLSNYEVEPISIRWSAMSLVYKVATVRRVQIDGYDMVFDRYLLLQLLLDDFGLAILGERFNIIKGHYRLFRVDLLLVNDRYVPITQCLCIPSFSLKVKKYCRLQLSAIIQNRAILQSVLSTDNHRTTLAYLLAEFAEQDLRKVKPEDRAARRLDKAIKLVSSSAKKLGSQGLVPSSTDLQSRPIMLHTPSLKRG
jgi:hypothetical protein